MSSLNAFLNPVQIENREVIVSNRFKENGKPAPFVIRPITQEENKQLIKKHTKRDKKGVRPLTELNMWLLSLRPP